MIELDFSNAGVKINRNELSKIGNEIPHFATHIENVKELDIALKEYQKFKNIVVIGNGGSVNSFVALRDSLVNYRNDKNVVVLNTMEPDFINDIKKKFPRKDTLVIAISKSGNTVGVLESLFAFRGYKTLCVTSGGALKKIAERMNMEVIEHPDVGGRYAGNTSCAYVPSILCGILADKIQSGAKKMYNKCEPGKDIEKNPALKLSAILYELDKKGFTEIFCPVYSTRLSNFLPIIIQLMHESVCKQRKGQTVFGSLAPESQHHTNQRFFGGRKNILGLFIMVKKQDNDSNVSIPTSLGSIKLRNGFLLDLGGVPYSKSLESEFIGTRNDAVKNKIPVITLTVNKVTPESVGELLAFFQYVAYYSSLLRGVDPFNQPHVEESKRISFEMREKYRK